MQAMAIDKRSKRPSYLQMADILRSQIADGTYPPDAQLPSIKQLCIDYGLVDHTVQRAIHILEDEGLVVAVSGRGTFVLRQPAGPPHS